MRIKCQTLRRSAITGCALLSLCCMPIAMNAQETTPQDTTPPPSTTAPDNSSVNKTENHAHHKHHHMGAMKTADQQKENAGDRDITKKIRQSLIADKSLSTYGHNIKIITDGGAVTLKGPVHSEEEKTAIAAKAAEVAGQDKVTNLLTVKP